MLNTVGARYSSDWNTGGIQHLGPRMEPQSSSSRLGHIYSFLYLVTQGFMVQKEALSFPPPERVQLWLVYILERLILSSATSD